MKVLIPGSFDPVTLGHLDIIRRAASIFDEVTVCAFVNTEKKPLFTPEQRLELLRVSTAGLVNVSCDISNDMVVDYAAAHGIRALVKGIRNTGDWEYEYTVASANRIFGDGLETVFLPSGGELSHISSTVVRDLIKYGKALDGWVPENAIELIWRMYTK